MKLLNDIPTKDLVSLDIETVRIVENYEDLSEEYKSAWEYKNKQDGKIPEFEVLADLWERTASLYAEFAKVCAVSLTFLDKKQEKLLCKEFKGYEEITLLEVLGDFLNRIHSNGINFRLVAHAGKYFDYPFLSKRYVINTLDIPKILDTAHLKPWETRNIDTNMDVWKMGGTGPGSSLQALCVALNIPISKVDLVGDEVGKAYYNGEIDKISRYCSYDAIATFNLIRRIKKEDIFEFSDVVFLDEEESIKETPLLNRIYTNKEITDKDIEELRKLFLVHKPNEEEVEIIRDILISIYLKTDFDNKDSKKEAKEKEEDINNLIDSLCKK